MVYNVGLGAPGRGLEQVEATTEKRPMVIRGNRLFFRDIKCTEIPGRPDLTGICAMIS